MANKKTMMALAGVVALSGVLAACGSPSNQNEAAGEGGSTAEPVKISIMSDYFSPEPPKEDDPIRLEIEKQSNTKLDITWVSSNNYTDKTNVTLASGDMPDLMLIRDPYQPQVRKIADQGAFWDLTPHLKDYPNLSGIPEASWENTSLNGHYYGIPFYRPLYGTEGMPIIRKDWMDKLGLEQPRTMDDMYNLLKAFTENDPDGNGKKDTIGLIASIGNLNWVENTMNANLGKWKEQDGQLIDMTFAEGTREALVWLNKAYSEGLLAADFPTLKNTQIREGVTTGKAGVFSDAMKPTWLLTGQMRASNPEADLLYTSYLDGPNGRYSPMGSGAYGFWVIPKSVSEEKMKQILAFMDYGASEEGSIMANYGMEGEHYTKKDDMYIFTEKAKSYSGVIFPVFGDINPYAFAYQTGIPEDFLKRNMAILDEMMTQSNANPSIGLNSETQNKVGPEYDKRIQDLKVKIILGRDPIDAWDSFVAELQADAQYQQIISEINEAYKQKQGN